MKGERLKEYYIYSPWLRIFHWTMAGSVITLFATGLYIGNPFFLGSQGLEPTYAFKARLSMATIRFVHFSAAYILVAALILRVYGFAVNKGDRLLPRFWTRLFWDGLKEMFLHYLFIRPAHQPYLRNPLARASYLAVYALLAVEIITGFAMYFMIKPDGWGAKLFGGVNHLLVDEYLVHVVHHYVAWAIALFVIVHVYMVIRADFMEREGELSSMISGVKFFAHEPADIGDISHETHNSSGDRQHSAAG